MGPLTLVRWPLYRAFKVRATLKPGFKLERVPHPKIEKDKCAFFFLYGKLLTLPLRLKFGSATFFWLIAKLSSSWLVPVKSNLN